MPPGGPGVRRASNRRGWHARGVRLKRLAWLVTTLGCLLAALVVFLRGDDGYAAVAVAVALSAAINLF